MVSNTRVKGRSIRTNTSQKLFENGLGGTSARSNVRKQVPLQNMDKFFLSLQKYIQ
ncbi:hypothetical protein LEP1GSC079_2326 [Leptospira interrogans str. FPW1039]|uniref:Uncharacterized protein n=2 Tax=Leptospira interrogans TaxID=173 RepID=A0A0F6HAW6_LEPIR|nr:hypothetical protein LEP1GSC045_0417 [Leptospira interrogans serovar Pomona str. Kennewicki LC82-25]EKN96048.1 hypothetical protein LEP1GSC014_4449 [Leptospira interrogans serovar Pomona str. Pomona]EKO25424.1 hypothetical protein LEP1GSC104_3577 [Leptospira interrogans str. UI 12621]EKO70422.1 hypothetical protein LEP1GSC069_2861 [Leptospira interrogans serovar Canicola str. Fiocruz LV133]EMF33273.1 hypothetical protein LEP1GSC201_4338 [Leptospira interrogans serovar Pomona str. Fox 32256]